VQPGVRNLAISEAAAPYGLYYAPDPSSQIACSIGGNVAENSGGVHCLKYGLTVHNVLKRARRHDRGRDRRTGRRRLDARRLRPAGADDRLRGPAGVVTEITVKLLPKPQLARVCLWRPSTTSRRPAARSPNIIAAGIIPPGLEMMDKLATRRSSSSCTPATTARRRGDPAVRIRRHAGRGRRGDRAHGSEVLRASGATQIRVSRDEAERLRFWSGRKAAFPAVGRISPDYYCMDGTIPRRRKLAGVLRGIAKLGRRNTGSRCPNVFHAGDGNLHPLILFDANIPGEAERAEAFGSRILELCIEVGGTITGEHGVGVEKIDQMCVQFRARTGAVPRVKAAFDPHGLLNPGKAVPTLHRCAEYGAHARQRGSSPIPDLPRF
jgi:glycolate oxidase